VGAAAGYDRLISFDMGGTSTDVSLIDRGLPISAESAVDGFPVNVPMLDIHTVGAGGGSIARIDAAGALKVGPQSAGAFPGPMCYGNGSKLTVTDANLFLGRLQPDLFLGGRMQLETSGVIREMGRMAASAGLSPASLARGILSVANAAMERAIRRISVERGRDPQAFTLLAFGGAGGLHAAFLARLLGMKRICVPRHPGILSAAGMLAADVVRDYSQTVMLDPAETDAARLDALFENLTRQAKSEMAAEGLQESGVEMKRSADMRYKGQSYEIRVDFDTDCIARFHRAHEERYGFSDPAQPVELVNIRLRAVCPPPEKMALTRMPEKGPQVPESAFLGRRPVGFSSDAVPTPVFDRSRLLPGNRIQGPAIAVEYSSTVVVPPDAEARVDGYENILITLGQSPAPGQEKEQGRHGSRRA
jgi:N-methylhydantoinase A